LAGSYRKRALAKLVAAKLSKQKITIFLRLFIVRSAYQVQALSLDGIVVIGDGRRFCANVHTLIRTNRARQFGPLQTTTGAPLTDQIFLIHGSALVLHVGQAQCFYVDRRSHSRGGGMIQVSTGVFVAITAALVVMGSLLAFAWFMVNSAINRIVLLEVRVETLEKTLGSNRFDDQ